MKTVFELNALAIAHNAAMMQTTLPMKPDPEFDAAIESLTDEEMDWVLSRVSELRGRDGTV